MRGRAKSKGGKISNVGVRVKSLATRDATEICIHVIVSHVTASIYKKWRFSQLRFIEY